MPHILEDRVLESSTSTGTGAFALAGAITGFRRFSAVCGLADTVDYFIEAIDSVGLPTGEYEYGVGTYSAANTMTRTLVRGSSNGGAAVNFTAGSKNVGLGLQAGSFGRSLASNGYQRMPGGLILQWGLATAFSGSPYATCAVTFPIAFPTACLSYSATSQGAAVSCAVAGASPTGMTITSSSASSAFAQWMAIGH